MTVEVRRLQRLPLSPWAREARPAVLGTNKLFCERLQTAALLKAETDLLLA